MLTQLEEEHNLEDIQNKIIELALIIFSSLGIISLILNVIRAVYKNMTVVLTIHTSVVILLVLLLIFRNKVSHNLKAAGLLIAIYVVITVGLYQLGFVASAKALIVVLPVLTSFVLSHQKAILVSLLLLITYVIFGSLFVSGVFTDITYQTNYTSHNAVWLLDGAVIFLASFTLLFGSQIYRKAILHNFSVIRKHSAELITKEQKYKMLFETSNDAILLFDEGVFVDCNQKALTLFDCTARDIIGKTPIDFSPVEQPDGQLSKEKAPKFIQKAFEGVSQSFEWQHCKLNGEVFEASINLSLVALEEENYIQAVIRDITDQKNAERKIVAYQKGLEELVKARTQELEAANEDFKHANQELTTQKEMLSKTLSELRRTQEHLVETAKMASIGTLTAGVGHEINNPLNFIMGGLHNLECAIRQPESFEDDNELCAVQEEGLQTIKEGIGRIHEITKSLDHFNRSNQKKLGLCNLHAIINNCLQILNHEIKYKGKVLKTYHQQDILFVGNEGQLHQVFLNIISNAIQSFDKNGLITITTKLLTEQNLIEVDISDNGAGIAPTHLDKVFDPFFTTKDPGLGKGLGLSMAHRIIQEHSGQINISSTTAGTQVVVQLPLKSTA